MTDAQKFTELTGGCWHEPELSPYCRIITDDRYGGRYQCTSYKCIKCGKEFKLRDNPTYSNPADILNRMKEKCGEERVKEFVQKLIIDSRLSGYDATSLILWFIYKYILNTPALLQKAIEFLEGK